MLHAKFVILLIENSSVVTLIWSEIKVLIGVESKQMHISPKINFKLFLCMIFSFSILIRFPMIT